MPNRKKDTVEFCPNCGKGQISRITPPLYAGILDAGGWQTQCEVCQRKLFVPLDLNMPIEALPADTEIFFDEEGKQLEAMVEGGK